MGVSYEDLSPEVIAACKTRLLDSCACLAGAYDAPVSRAVRAMAARYSGTPSASVFGVHQKTTVEMAAFANGVMMRLLDMSDMYRLKSGGHPSDVIAPILAIGEAVRADGRSILTAIAIAYEIYCAFCDAIDINSQGWDQPVYAGLASTLAGGKLMGLPRVGMANAVSLSLVPNMATFQTRTGELSNWKGCAAANAARNAVFALLLAQDGITGPTAPFEGPAGLWDIVGRFSWPALGPSPRRILNTHLKCFPICYHGQSAVWAALELRSRMRVEEVEEIRIETYKHAVEEMGADASRWAPNTHETADHSLPYVVATALLDGKIGPESFSDEKLHDARTVRLMRATTVAETSGLSAQYPESSPCHLTIRKMDGSAVDIYVRYPKGHAKSPLSDVELETKFVSLGRGFADGAGPISGAIAGLEHAAGVEALLRHFHAPADHRRSN